MKSFICKLIGFFAILIAFNSHADIEAMKARVPALVKAKESGLIGEQRDGLIGAIDSSKLDQKTKALVNSENKDRLKIYTKRASEQEQELPVFMKVMGEARVEQEKKGRFVQSLDGTWIKK